MKVKKFFKQNTRYYVDEKNRTVTAVCRIEEGLFAFARAVSEIANIRVSIPRNIDGLAHGVATCHAEDIWDEEKGKRLAFETMYRKEIKPALFDALYHLRRKNNQLETIIEDTLRVSKTRRRIIGEGE